MCTGIKKKKETRSTQEPIDIVSVAVFAILYNSCFSMLKMHGCGGGEGILCNP